MHLYFTNVNDAFTSICRGFHTGTFESTLPVHPASGQRFSRIDTPSLSRGPSRYGQVIRVEEPVTITYLEPLQRVLFHPIRDCNPFFHLIEALWMLSGQNNVRPLAHFAKRMMEFSDDDLSENSFPTRGSVSKWWQPGTLGYMWGAYGYRWRNWFQIDQIETAIKVLRSDPKTRRVVLQMWEPRDLQRVAEKSDCKDIPCNLEVLLSPRASTDTYRYHVGQTPKKETVRQADVTQTRMISAEHISDGVMQGCTCLDMTVINRSNDTLWGALGSNYVHFTFLHEYIANAVGMAVGYYHQISNNLHIYDSTELGVRSPSKGKWSGKWEAEELVKDFPTPYVGDYIHYPLFKAPFNDFDEVDKTRKRFDAACKELFNSECLFSPLENKSICHIYFSDVVTPLLKAWQYHKAKDYDAALFHAGQILPTDWRIACIQWLRRRQAKRLSVQEQLPNVCH